MARATTALPQPSWVGASILLFLVMLLVGCGGNLPATAEPSTPPATFTAAVVPTPLATEPSPTLAPLPTRTAPAAPSTTPVPEPTGTEAAAQATPAGAALLALFPELSAIDTASAMSIQDDWLGLSPLAPIEAHYSLRRDGDLFKGEADFSVAGSTGNPSRSRADVEIPADLMAIALRALAGAPASEGKYEPRIEHTDDYPARRIEIETPDGPLVFLSGSQGDGNVPWGAQYKGREFIVPSALPSEAIETLDPYLARDVQENLIDSVRNSP